MRGATILVVEDEEMLREFVRSVLESLGYRFLGAANGVQALDISERGRDGIQLLFTDVVMPESISGWQLARRLMQKKPDLRVIFTSGYSTELISPGVRSLWHGFLSREAFPHGQADPDHRLLPARRLCGGWRGAVGARLRLTRGRRGPNF